MVSGGPVRPARAEARAYTPKPRERGWNTRHSAPFTGLRRVALPFTAGRMGSPPRRAETQNPRTPPLIILAGESFGFADAWPSHCDRRHDRKTVPIRRTATRIPKARPLTRRPLTTLPA